MRLRHNIVKIRNKSGDIETVEANRFKAYIGQYQYEFFFIKDKTNNIRVSDYNSGQLFNSIKYEDYREKPIDVAKRAISNVVDKYGSDRVQVILKSAESLY